MSLQPAASVTARQPGYAFEMAFAIDGAGQHASITAHGTFDTHTGQGTLSEAISGHQVNGVFKLPYLYLRALRPSAATGGKPWVRLDLRAENALLGQGGEAAPTDPAATLGYLRQMGNVTAVGPAKVDGVPTTRYHGIVDLNRVAATAPPAQRSARQGQAQLFKRLTGATTFPVDAWVDHTGLVRQVSFHVPVCTRAGRFSVSTTMQIKRYGPQPVVNVPPPSQVADLTSKLRAQNAAALRAAC